MKNVCIAPNYAAAFVAIVPGAPDEAGARSTKADAEKRAAAALSKKGKEAAEAAPKTADKATGL